MEFGLQTHMRRYFVWHWSRFSHPTKLTHCSIAITIVSYDFLTRILNVTWPVFKDTKCTDCNWCSKYMYSVCPKLFPTTTGFFASDLFRCFALCFTHIGCSVVCFFIMATTAFMSRSTDFRHIAHSHTAYNNNKQYDMRTKTQWKIWTCNSTSHHLAELQLHRLHMDMKSRNERKQSYLRRLHRWLLCTICRQRYI